MKIAYLVNRYPAVSHTFIRREIDALEVLGVQVVRFALRATKDSELLDPSDRLEAERTRAVLAAPKMHFLGAVVMSLIGKPVKFMRALKATYKLHELSDRGIIRHLAYLVEACVLHYWLGKAGVCHVHAHFGTNAAAVAMLSHVLGGPPFSFTVHGPEEFDKPESLGLQMKIRFARFVVAVSQFGRSQLFRWCHLDDWPKIHVVHCGVDGSFAPILLTPIPDVPQLVCVGRLCEQKGQLLLVQAVKLLVSEGVRIRLVLVGGGEMREVIERQVKELALGQHVVMAGPQTGQDVRRIISESRGLVLSSFAEGLPVVIMEALSLGRPVISTFVAGIPELVVPGECGWLVPAGDVTALVAAIRELLAMPLSVLAEMGSIGARRVASRHCASIEAKKLLALIGQGVSDRPAAVYTTRDNSGFASPLGCIATVNNNRSAFLSRSSGYEKDGTR